MTRGVDIAWQLPGDAELVHGDRADVDRLILLTAYQLVRGAPPGAALRIAFESSAHAPALAFELRARAERCAASTAASDWDRAVAQAAARLAERNGVCIEASGTGDTVRLRFARPRGDAP